MQGERFIADVHLGKLARYLRLLGQDTVYQNDFTIEQLTAIAVREDRTLLSRNKALGKGTPVKSYIINSADPNMQIRDVISYFELGPWIRLFTRCLVCNGTLHIVAKDEIIHSLLPNTTEGYQDFWKCGNCGNVYWKGSHYERMNIWVEGLDIH